MITNCGKRQILTKKTNFFIFFKKILIFRYLEYMEHLLHYRKIYILSSIILFSYECKSTTNYKGFPI